MVETFRDPSSFPRPYDLSIASRRPSAETARTIVHKVPKYPVLHNGVLYDPGDIVRFNGRALLYMVDRRLTSKILIVDEPESIRIILTTKIIAALTDRSSEIIDVVESKAVPPTNPPVSPQDGTIVVTPPAPTQRRTPSGPPAPPELHLFSQFNYRGSELVLGPGLAYYDLTKVSLMWLDDWNDEIASVAPTSSTAILNEHVNFTGSFFAIEYVRFDLNNLGDFGWDARTSSVCNYG